MWAKAVDHCTFTGTADSTLNGFASIHMAIAGTEIAIFQMLVGLFYT
jgi:hypothetical protein